jgi:hypothetical protein
MKKLFPAIARIDAGSVGQIRMTRQRFPDSPQETFFVEWLKEARDRFRLADYFSGLRIVTAADKDRRQAPSRFDHFPAQFDPGHRGHVNVQQQASVAIRKFARKELFGAAKVRYVESQNLELSSQRPTDGRVVIYHNHCGRRILPQLTIPASWDNGRPSSARSLAR